eukprot:3041998-Lingulodinium_polyedra.AAC.1
MAPITRAGNGDRMHTIDHRMEAYRACDTAQRNWQTDGTRRGGVRNNDAPPALGWGGAPNGRGGRRPCPSKRIRTLIH